MSPIGTQRPWRHSSNMSAVERKPAVPSRCLANKWRFETRSEPHAGAAVHGPGGKVLAAEAADQMDLRVGVLPTETTVEAGDTRRRLVAPALILEPLRGKIERPSAICVALSVRVYNH